MPLYLILTESTPCGFHSILLAVSLTKLLESVVNTKLLGCNEKIESVISNTLASAASLTLIKHFEDGVLGVFQTKLLMVPVISALRVVQVVPLSIEISSLIFSILLFFQVMVVLFCTESISPPLGYNNLMLLKLFDLDVCPS